MCAKEEKQKIYIYSTQVYQDLRASILCLRCYVFIVHKLPMSIDDRMDCKPSGKLIM